MEAVGVIELVVLVALGLAAGFVNTLAGGGSAVTVPALIVMGLPAHVANATNRVAIFVQCAVATRAFDREGVLDREAIVRTVIPTLFGAGAGAWLAARMNPELLEPILLAVMLAVAASMLVPRDETPVARAALGTGSRGALGMALVAVGVYGGFVQAGVGLALLGLLGGGLGYDLVRANALKAAIITAYTAVALVVFLVEDLIRWVPAIALTLGNVVGARLGVRFAVERGQGPIRMLVFVMVLVTCAAALAR